MSVLVLGCGQANKPKEELLHEGIKLAGEKNSRGAVVLFKTALEKDANYFEARFQLAKAYSNLGNLESAEKELQKVIRQSPSLKEARVELAKVYVQKSKPAEALKELSEFINEGSTDSEALEVAGWAHIVMKDYPGAVTYLKKSIAAGDRIEPRLYLARVYMQMGDKAATENQISDILAKEAGNVGALYLLAESQTAQEDLKAALETYERILREHPEEIQASFKKGTILLENGKYSEAAALADSVIEKNPNRAEGHRLKGLAMLHMKDYENAITSLQKCLSYAVDPGTYYFLGMAHFHKGEPEQATSQFQKALDLAPEFPQSRIMLSLVLLRQNRLDDAVNEARKALDSDADNALAHNVLGNAYMAKGMQEEGMAELNRALELDPNLIDAHMKKGVYNLSKGRYREAELNLKKAVEAAPDLLNTRVMLATNYLKNKEFGKAKETLSKGLSGGQSDAVIHNMIGEVLLREGKSGEAVKSFEKSKAANPDYPAPYMSLAMLNVFAGKQEKGIEELKSLVQRAPDNVKALITIGTLLEASGKADEAAQYYKKAEATAKVEAYSSLANHYLGRREIGKAVSYLDKAIEKEPKNAFHYELKGKALMADRRYKDAFEVFDALEKIDPKLAHGRKLDALLALNDHKRALDLINGRLAKEPENPEFLAEQSRVYSLMGKYAEAEDAARRVIARNPDSPAGYMVLAMAYQSSKQEAKAIEALKKAVSMKSKNTAPHMALGLIYTAKKDYGAALDIFRKAEKASPTNVAVIFQQGATLELMGRKKESMIEYQRALRVSPNFVPALNNLAYLTAESDPAKALQLAKKAFVLAPKDAAVLDTLGMMLARTGNYAAAVKMLKSATEALPGNPTVLYHYGTALNGAGDKAGAVAALEKAVGAGEFPESDKARQLLSELNKGQRKTR
jgi:putative PEP-CTERM system TPR-repeat lipoprotein